MEKYAGHSLKIWAPLRKLFAPSGVPSSLRACFNQDADRTIRTE